MGTEIAQADLLPNQKRAAYLHSQGLKAKDISELVGIAPSTLSAWMKMNAFHAESERWLEMSTGRVDALFATVRGEYLDGAIEAIESARAGLQAVTGDGEPRWDVRIRCQEILLKHLTLQDKAAGGEGAGASSASVVIHLGSDERDSVNVSGIKVDAESGKVPSVRVLEDGTVRATHRHG